MKLSELQQAVAHTDLSLLDQILKGRFSAVHRLLDAGCGEGRNMGWFLKQDVQVYGIDVQAEAVQYARAWAKTIQTTFEPSQIMEGDLAKMPFPDHFFDAVLCNAVLHFAQDELHFRTMWAELTRVVRPNGVLFVRLSSLHGIDYSPRALGNSRYQLSDGSEWYLPTLGTFDALIKEHRMQRIEPVKTVVIERTRTMTTLVLGK